VRSAVSLRVEVATANSEKIVKITEEPGIA
jgi:hypothetical protein